MAGQPAILVCRHHLHLHVSWVPLPVRHPATRKVLAWRLANTLTTDFCTATLTGALVRHGTPEIFNTDQGGQFTGAEFTDMLKTHGIQISMDGRGHCHDNIFVERLWWTVVHEWVYLRPCPNDRDHRRHPFTKIAGKHKKT